MIDPNETWGEFISSMVGFDDPKMVPLESLPDDFDPKKRKFNTLKSVINWRNQNYIENWKPKRVNTAEFKDIEQNDMIAKEEQPMDVVDQTA